MKRGHVLETCLVRLRRVLRGNTASMRERVFAIFHVQQCFYLRLWWADVWGTVELS